MYKNKIISAYLTSILGVFSGLLTNFWLLKELTIHIAPADFGLYSYIFQISSYLLILQLGMDFSVSRQIAEYLGKGETAHAGIAFYELKRFNRYGMMLVLLAVGVLMVLFYQGFGVDPVRRDLAVKLILLTGINQVLVFLQRPFAAALIGAHKQEVVNIITVIRTVLTTLIAYGLLRGGMGVLSTPLAEIGTQIAGNGFLMYYSQQKLEWIAHKHSQRNRDIFKKLFHFAFFSTIGGLAWTVEATSDVLLIRHVLKDLSLLSLYVVWWRFPQMFFDLATRFASSAFPVFAARHGANDGSATQTLSKVLLVVVFFASLACIGIATWLPTFISLWFPSDYQYFQPYQLAIGMGMLVALRIIGNLFAFFLLSAGNTKLTTRVAWLQAIVKVLLAWYAVTHWSLTGLLVASCIAASLQSLFYGMYMLRKQQIKGNAIAFMVLVMLAACSAVCLLPPMSLHMQLWQMILGTIATSIVWLICYITMAFFSKAFQPLVIQQFAWIRQKWIARTKTS